MKQGIGNVNSVELAEKQGLADGGGIIGFNVTLIQINGYVNQHQEVGVWHDICTFSLRCEVAKKKFGCK